MCRIELGGGWTGGRLRVWDGGELEELADTQLLLLGLEAEPHAGLIAAERIDADVNLEVLFACRFACLLRIERKKAGCSDRKRVREGATQTGLAHVEADTKDDRVAIDQVHVTFGAEAWEPIEKAAGRAHSAM